MPTEKGDATRRPDQVRRRRQPDTTISKCDGDGNLTQEIDPDGNVSDFLYDSLGDETQAIEGVGTSQQAASEDYYDGDDNLTLSIDPDGDSTSYLYDSDGNNTLMIEGYGSSAASSTSMAYDAAGNETLVVTGYGTASAESTFYAYDANGNQTEVITGYNSSQPDTTISQYDGDGNLTQQTDPDGDVSDFLYDSLGDQTLSVLGAGTAQAASGHEYYDGDDNLTLSIDADGDSTSYLYDADGDETLAIQGYGSSAASTSSYAYDAAGEQTLAVTGYGTTAAESAFYAYDANGNQTLTITGYNSSKPESTVSRYDGDGNRTQQIDADGDTSDFAYDALGDQTLSVLGAGTAQAASSHDYYDGDDNLTLSVDADGDSTSYLYDADGNNTLTIEGVGTSSASTTSMAYDTDGDNTLMIEGVGTSAASTTSMAYDAAGNQTLAVTGYNSSNPETTIARYDGDGNLTQEVNADGDTSDFAYDSVGDQTLAVDGAGSSAAGSTSDYYDGDGNLTLTVNPVGDSTSYQYDADGNQTLEIDGYGSDSAATIHYLYDANGNQTQEVDPDGNTTSWEYDADGDQTLMIQAYGTSSAATTSYEYDNDGNQTLQVNPNGTSIASSYDADGDLISETWYNADGSTANSSSYTYDPDGNIVTAGNDAGTYSFGYNADGEQTLVVNPNGVTLNYQYDADGNATLISDSLGDTVTSQYDADGDLISIGYSGPNGAQLLVELGYDDDGNLTSISRYSDTAGTQLVGTSSYAYNSQGDVTSIVHTNASGTTLDSFDYSYDAADELTQEVANGTTTAYSYDATGQLVSAGPMAYSYDANGNPDDSGDSIGPNNELLSDGTWNYSYDANGNMIGKTGVSGGPDAGLTWAYAYDPGNELISATETNSQSQTLVQETFTYDVFGNILATSLSTDGGSPVDTDYVYNGSTLWATTTASNVPEDFYLSGDQPDQYFAQYDATNGPAWYLNNNLGSVCTTMSNSGAAIDNIVYDANGNVVSQTNSAQQPLPGFTGLMTIAALGVDAADVRIYDPQSEQWMQQDPDLLTPGPNPREYVNDAPTNFTDPTGQEPLFPGFDKWMDRNVGDPLGRLYNKAAAVTRKAANINARLAQPGAIITQAGLEAAAKWWVGADVFLKEAEGAKLEGEKVLQPVEGDHDYFSLYVENSILLLRKFKGDYYLVGSTANVPGSRSNDQKLKTVRDIYENKQKLRYLQWAQSGLEISLSLLPLGQTALLLSEGKYEEAGKAALFDAAALLPGLGARVKAAGVARALKTGTKGLLRAGKALGAAAAVVNGIGLAVTVKDMAQAIQSGQYTWGQIAAYGGQSVMMLLGVRSGLKTALKCFPSGTPVRTVEGEKSIELLRKGDWVLARPEGEVGGAVSACRVKAVHVRVGVVVEVLLGGRGIRVTPEHPFYERSRGWVGAGTLRAGEEVSLEDGGWLRVEGVRETGEEVAVYNLTVSDYHTYFVGSRSWGFAVWVHNADVKDYMAGLPQVGTQAEKAAAEEAEQAAANAPQNVPAQSNRVFRGLAEGENPAAGLSARSPGAGNSVASHVAGKRASQWISTTTEESVARGRFGTHGVVEIDLSKVTSEIVDISRGIPGMEGSMLSNWAAKMREVLIRDFIPPEAIRPLP